MGKASAAVIAAFLIFCGSCASAQDVTLTSPDGGVEISGNLLGFDGEFYRVDTIYGELTVDGSGVQCDGPGCPSLLDFVPEIRLSGAAALGEIMMPALVEAFAQRSGLLSERAQLGSNDFRVTLTDPKTSKTVAIFDLGATTTDEGFADLLANEADIVLSMREIKSAELELASEAGLGNLNGRNRSRVLALDALVPVVSPVNPVQHIRPLDLARVFGGEITNWSVLGGPDAPIALHLPDERTGLGRVVENRLLGAANLTASSDITRHRLSTALASAVKQDPFALGIASYAETGDAQVLTLLGDCGYDLHADRHSIKTEDYPLTSPMFLYLPARRLPKIGREFLAFLRSPQAQLVIRRVGFVDQSPEEISLDQQGARLINAIDAAGPEISILELQRMVNTLAPLKRLTTSFRFEAGSTRLDIQSRSNVLQLAHALEQGRYDAGEVVFVGFSDGRGDALQNQAIAYERAQSVKDAVVAAAETIDLEQVALRIEAFGEAMPLACDDSVWGRQANRRVEVWIK